MRRARPLLRFASLALIVLAVLSLAFVPKVGQPASLVFAAEPSANFEQTVDDEQAAETEPVADGEKAMEGAQSAEAEQAVQPDTSTYSSQTDSPSVLPGDASIALSQPDVTTTGDRVLYTTTLTVSGIESFFGYQIQIAVPTDGEIVINNLVGGSTTDPVMRDGNLYFATILGEQQSGEIALCEIHCSYPSGSAESGRSLTVTTLKLITSIASESVLTFGPDPVAASLVLSSPSSLFDLPLWAVAAIIAVIIGVFVAVRLEIRWQRNQARHFKPGTSSQRLSQTALSMVARRRV